MKTLENRISTQVPAVILTAISRVHCKYSSIDHLFHCFQVDIKKWVGVIGDGANGCYEYFVWHDGKLTHSNDGYGSTDIALRDVLNRELA